MNDETKLLVPYFFTMATTIIMYAFIFSFWRSTCTAFDKSGTYRHDELGFEQGYS